MGFRVQGLAFRLQSLPLIGEAKKNHLVLPPKPTRGYLIRMLGDAKSTDDDLIMTFGRLARYFFREVPASYRAWAVKEAKARSSHPDLVRFANWVREDDAESLARDMPLFLSNYSSSSKKWAMKLVTLKKGQLMYVHTHT